MTNSGITVTTGLKSGGAGGIKIQNLIDNTLRFEPKLKDAMNETLEHERGVLEAYIKTNAPWTDQTGNARNGLFVRVDSEFMRSGGGQFSVGGQTFRLVLGHSVPYGIWLETTLRPHGKTARPIITPTIRDDPTHIMATLTDVFGRVK